MDCSEPLALPSKLALNPPSSWPKPGEAERLLDLPTSPKWLEVKRGKLTHAGIVTLTGIALVNALGPLLPHDAPEYEGTFQLAVEPSSNQAEHPQVTSPTTPEWTVDYETQARVLWSPKVVTPVVHHLQDTYPDLNVETVLRNLTVTHEQGSNRLSVSYRDSDQERTRIVLHQLAQSYLQFSQDCHGGPCRAVQLIDQQLPELQQQVAELKQTLNTFQQTTGAADPAQLGQHLTQRSQILIQQQQQLGIQMAESRACARILQQRLHLGHQPVAEGLLQQNARYQQLLAQLHPVVEQLVLALDRPQSDQASLKALQQQYQQLYMELSEVAQRVAIQGLPRIQSNIQLAKDPFELRLQMFQEWMGVTHQMQVIAIHQQAIHQAEQRTKPLIQQWSKLAHNYAKTQLALQTATDKLELYQTRKAELQAQLHAQPLARLVTPPTVL